MPFIVWPLRNVAGRQVLSDEVLLDVWRQIVEEDKVDLVFYAGGVCTPREFLEYILQPSLRVSLVIDAVSGLVCVLGWLTPAGDGSAFVHYCNLGRFRRDAGRTLLHHWCEPPEPGGRPVFEVLLGITPEPHAGAIRAARIMGFVPVGTIPRYCRWAAGTLRCGGVLSVFECPPG